MNINNRALLFVIAVLLVGILALMVMEMRDKESPAEKIGDSIGAAIDDAADSVGDSF